MYTIQEDGRRRTYRVGEPEGVLQLVGDGDELRLLGRSGAGYGGGGGGCGRVGRAVVVGFGVSFCLGGGWECVRTYHSTRRSSTSSRGSSSCSSRPASLDRPMAAAAAIVVCAFCRGGGCVGGGWVGLAWQRGRAQLEGSHTNAHTHSIRRSRAPVLRSATHSMRRLRQSRGILIKRMKHVAFVWPLHFTFTIILQTRARGAPSLVVNQFDRPSASQHRIARTRRQQRQTLPPITQPYPP